MTACTPILASVEHAPRVKRGPFTHDTTHYTPSTVALPLILGSGFSYASPSVHPSHISACAIVPILGSVVFHASPQTKTPEAVRAEDAEKLAKMEAEEASALQAAEGMCALAAAPQ